VVEVFCTSSCFNAVQSNHDFINYDGHDVIHLSIMI
jgi:hypothetical protein